MIVCYSALAADQEDRKKRQAELKKKYGGSGQVYSAYVDCRDDHKNKNFTERVAYRSMMAAIRKGRADRVVVESFQNLNLWCMEASYFLWKLFQLQISVQIGSVTLEPGTEEAFYEGSNQILMDYLMETYAVPLVTYASVRFRKSAGTGWVYPEGCLPGKEDPGALTQIDFPDLLDLDLQECYVYRPEKNDYDRLDPLCFTVLKDLFQIAYQTLFESMDLT